ncbi:hypothetical protein [Devosia sp. MC1541]|uniref:hypothetical protein n=1 Tax=Devosia sp. MC1541 TaxID=2725264 RepID=UPI00145E1896|nr:hypothetical protein [Devosia sp. MC1541]
MEFWVPLLSALMGALVGAASSVATMIVQAHRDDARHTRETAVTLALAEHTLHVDLAKGNGGQSILPITAYFTHHLHALNLARKGSLSADDMKALNAQMAEINRVLREGQE